MYVSRCTVIYNYMHFNLSVVLYIYLYVCTFVYLSVSISLCIYEYFLSIYQSVCFITISYLFIPPPFSLCLPINLSSQIDMTMHSNYEL